MAGMKRFVTYIYAYEEEKKGSNVGFARIEIRGQDARVEIHLRGVYAASAACRVYLFQREASGGKEATGVTGVLVGEMKLANGSGDGVVVLKGGRVGASPYGITEMEGLFFVIGEERILMSRWREGAPFKVGLSGFREWKPEETKEKTAEKGLAAETAAQNEVRDAAAVQPEQNSRMAVKGMAQGKQGEAAAAQPEQTSRMAAKGMPQEKRRETVSVVPEQKEKMPAQDVPSGFGMETAAAGEEMEAIHATELPMRNLFPEYDWNAVWEELCREHKPVALFEEWDMQCIQLELKDLRSLPKKYWYLGNNSFLLHGFFNYRYLLLGRTAEERWFLGVPGVYQRQERVMAAIFGFPEFFAAGPGGERGGSREPVNHFGCWVRYIEE
ncbi:DUF6128 domain-containing protein [Roseburia hominis]|uniref:DUF6128 domain-containing protein n=1 Tax=Roseburia hominis TaxID=301301 RepID=A0A395V4J8_9FIRM|nr:DUF6128 domain-containing protein [Roseburia hominis]RGS38004.1 hypothetical protein DWX93_13285 [Roseburia hominis]